MGQTLDECSDAELHDAAVGFFAAVKLLSQAAAYYTAQAANATDPTDKANFSAAAMDADNKRAALNASFDAFLNSGESVVPPSDDEVAAIVATAEQLAQAIAAGEQANDVLILVEHGLLAAQAIMS